MATHAHADVDFRVHARLLSDSVRTRSQSTPNLVNNPGLGAVMNPESGSWQALQTREYLSQPDFQAMIRNLNSNPASMNAYLADPRFQVHTRCCKIARNMMGRVGTHEEPRLCSLCSTVRNYLVFPVPCAGPCCSDRACDARS